MFGGPAVFLQYLWQVEHKDLILLFQVSWRWGRGPHLLSDSTIVLIELLLLLSPKQDCRCWIWLFQESEEPPSQHGNVELQNGSDWGICFQEQVEWGLLGSEFGLVLEILVHIMEAWGLTPPPQRGWLPVCADPQDAGKPRLVDNLSPVHHLSPRTSLKRK